MLNSTSPRPPTNVLTQTIETLASSLPLVWQEVLMEPTAAMALKLVTQYIERAQQIGANIYPADPFRALRSLIPSDVRVVIIAQDPYHGPGQAQGLAFSVPNDCLRPPSLRNIFKELARSYPDRPVATSNDLQCWVDQGVLLLNTCLTVEQGRPNAHAGQGWEIVTDALLTCVAKIRPKVFMLWGTHAQSKRALLSTKVGHLVLGANHPSPLSASRPPTPFLGCGHFEQANAWLVYNGKMPIDWLPK